MTAFDDSQLTEDVVRSFGTCNSQRLKSVMQSLVRHAHAFVRETRLSEEEWQTAIAFLTRTGHMCDGKRQEFILLSDVLGISMLVDAINHQGASGATDTTVLGPFYLGEHRVTAHGADIAAGVSGAPMFVDTTVLAVDGRPVAGATVDVWHSDEDGLYDAQKPDARGPELRARFITDEVGRLFFKSIVPTSYPIPTDGPVGNLLEQSGRHPMRPAHIHFRISAAGFRDLVTHVFVADDPWLASDAVFGVKDSLIAELPVNAAGAYPDGTAASAPWRLLRYDFKLEPLPA